MSRTGTRSGTKFSLSLDVWAVLLSFTLALLVRVGLIKSVGW